MTVKDLLQVVDETIEISIGRDGYTVKADLKNPLTAAAFGDYVIEKIMPTYNGNGIEATLKAEPVKAK